MSADWAALAVSKGAAQQTREPEALKPGYIRPQERTLPEHVAAAARLARQLVMPADADGAVDGGDWRDLFEHEPAVALARLLSIRTDQRRIAFDRALGRGGSAAADALRSLAAEIDGAQAALARRGYQGLVEAMEAAGDETAMPRLRALLEAPSPMTTGALAAALAEAGGAPLEGDALRRGHAARQALSRAHERLLDICDAVRAPAQAAFAARMEAGDMEPALGLVLAQFAALAPVETAINAFTARHVDFYHRTVLGLSPRPALPETILLRLRPTAAVAHVEAGARVIGEGPGLATPRRYEILESVRAIPAVVGDCRSLVHERDPAIYRQQALGYVTGVFAARRRFSETTVEGLFRAESRVFAPPGLEIASDMFRLAEGERRVTVRLGLRLRTPTIAPPDAIDDEARAAAPARCAAVLRAAFSPAAVAAAMRAAPALRDADTPAFRDAFLHALLLEATEAAQAQAVFGRLVAETLVERRAWPAGAYRRALLDALARLVDGPAPDGALAPARAVETAEDFFSRRPEEVMQQFLGGGFDVALSSAEGWRAVAAARAAPNGPDDGPGFQIRFALDAGAPPVAPAPGAAVPALRLTMTGESLFCPFSVLEPFALSEVRIDVAVAGLKRLVAFSDEGPLDVAQPFRPFGAAPRDGAALLIGAPELAVKPVTRLGADIRWAEAPGAEEGLQAHYRHYGEDFPPPEPTLRASYLGGDGEKTLGEALPMFARRPGGERLLASRRLDFAIPGRPAPGRTGVGPEDFRRRDMIGAGLLRLTLGCGPDGFGHAVYPRALARAMGPSPLPFGRRTPPRPPVTPTIAGIALSYRAAQTIDLDAPGAAAPDQRVVQTGPFGACEVFPNRAAPGAGVLMRRLANGAVFLRIDGADATGRLSLLFDMAEGSHRRTAFAPAPVTWRYLSDSGWRRLPAWRIASDSTDGFMRSGVVRLTVPPDAARASPEMPGEGLWLALCADAHLTFFPRLEAVWTNGARAIRVREDDAATAVDSPGAAPTAWRLDPADPSIAEVVRLAETVGGAPAEDAAAFRTRVAERLRHRGRAVAAWDLERMTLDAFPEVWKAKCLAATDWRRDGAEAGAVTVVVVPAPPPGAQEDPARPRMFDVLTLRRIRAHLMRRAPAFSAITVSNPAFDLLQARVRVRFAAERDDGSLTQRLGLELSRAFSLWTAEPPMNDFGWSLSLTDVAAFIGERDYVDAFGGLSLLALSRDDRDDHRLFDTARATPGGGDVTARPSRPWALALPMREQWITSARDVEATARPAGVGALPVGAGLVVAHGAAR